MSLHDLFEQLGRARGRSEHTEKYIRELEEKIIQVRRDAFEEVEILLGDDNLCPDCREKITKTIRKLKVGLWAV